MAANNIGVLNHVNNMKLFVVVKHLLYKLSAKIFSIFFII